MWRKYISNLPLLVIYGEVLTDCLCLQAAWRVVNETDRQRFVDLAAASKAAWAVATKEAEEAASASLQSVSPPGPRPKLTPGANGRRLYRGKDAARPRTGLKIAGGARGGGGAGKRMNVRPCSIFPLGCTGHSDNENDCYRLILLTRAARAVFLLLPGGSWRRCPILVGRPCTRRPLGRGRRKGR